MVNGNKNLIKSVFVLVAFLLFFFGCLLVNQDVIILKSHNYEIFQTNRESEMLRKTSQELQNVPFEYLFENYYKNEKASENSDDDNRVKMPNPMTLHFASNNWQMLVAQSTIIYLYKAYLDIRDQESGPTVRALAKMYRHQVGL